jgi:hypothetical protein
MNSYPFTILIKAISKKDCSYSCGSKAATSAVKSCASSLLLLLTCYCVFIEMSV